MRLQERLDKYRAAFQKKAPPKALAVMHRVTADLEASGIVAKALKAGDKAPAFTLDNQDGVSVSLGSVLAKGPVILGFYRGRW
jgi:hypothetical protein